MRTQEGEGIRVLGEIIVVVHVPVLVVVTEIRLKIIRQRLCLVSVFDAED